MNLLKIKEDELKNCNTIKALMMLVIVFYHCCYFRAGGVTIVPKTEPQIINYLFKLIVDFFSSFQNQTFVLVSGYIFAFVLNERKSYTSFGVFIGKKVRRLLIPFVFVLILWQIPIKLLLGNQSAKILYDCFLATHPDQLHFILMLFWVFLIAWFAAPIWNEKPYMSLVILVGIYYVGSFVNIYSEDYFRLLETCKELIFFFFGYSIRLFDCERIRDIKLSLGGFLWAALFISSELLQFFEPPGYVMIDELIGLPLHASGVFCVFFSLNKIVSYFGLSDRKYIILLKKRMMGIYLFHQQIIYLVVLLFVGKLNSFVLVLVTFIITIIISFIITSIFLRFRMTRKLIGEK